MVRYYCQYGPKRSCSVILDLFFYRSMLFHQTQKYFVLFWEVVFHQGNICLWLMYSDVTKKTQTELLH